MRKVLIVINITLTLCIVAFMYGFLTDDFGTGMLYIFMIAGTVSSFPICKKRWEEVKQHMRTGSYETRSERMERRRNYKM